MLSDDRLCIDVVLVAVSVEEPDQIQLKGDLGIAAVVLRDGEQARHAGTVMMRAGDRLRFEVTVPKAQIVLVALVEENWKLTGLEERQFDGGTHSLASAFRVDDAAMRARIVVGEPGRVRRAISEKNLGGLAVLELESEGR